MSQRFPIPTEADLKYYTNCRADREQDDDTSRPSISAWPESLEQYDVIFLGYPIWHGQVSKILYTMLEGVDISGMTVLPFCTSVSSGAGTSARNLKEPTGQVAVWLDAKLIENGSTPDDIRTGV